mmetsp:Transcript_17913/g.38110  ORF Transcript_17913/g.38110 Transcript_17913/m.38110 type:complete len:220 (+) Transcript_17913:404-1063(+)
MQGVGIGTVLLVKGREGILRMLLHNGPENCSVLQSRVNALAGGRLHGMGSVADEADPPGGIEGRALHNQAIKCTAFVESPVGLIIQQVLRSECGILLCVRPQLLNPLLGGIVCSQEVLVETWEDTQGDAPNLVGLLAHIALVTEHEMSFRVHFRLPRAATRGHEAQLESPGILLDIEARHPCGTSPPNLRAVAVCSHQACDASQRHARTVRCRKGARLR